MGKSIALFFGTFTTLLAVINPLESLPIFLELMAGQDMQAHRQVARRACYYTAGLIFFFLVFGTLVLQLFSVSLSMVRIVGGIILVRIGFSLFLPSSSGGVIPSRGSGSGQPAGNIAFVPLAMPLMFGPGVLATIISMSSLVKHPISDFVDLSGIILAILAAVSVTYLILAYADEVLGRIGPDGIDAATRIVGFFVAAIGMGLVFHGVVDALYDYKVITMY
jgi:multiple antibiotic resistance protein